MKTLNNIRDQLLQIRDIKKVPYSYLQKQTGINGSNLHKYLHGKKEITLQVAEKIASALDLDLEIVFSCKEVLYIEIKDQGNILLADLKNRFGTIIQTGTLGYILLHNLSQQKNIINYSQCLELFVEKTNEILSKIELKSQIAILKK